MITVDNLRFIEACATTASALVDTVRSLEAQLLAHAGAREEMAQQIHHLTEQAANWKAKCGHMFTRDEARCVAKGMVPDGGPAKTWADIENVIAFARNRDRPLCSHGDCTHPVKNDGDTCFAHPRSMWSGSRT